MKSRLHLPGYKNINSLKKLVDIGHRSGRLQCCGNQEVSAWRTQDRRHKGGKQRRHRGALESIFGWQGGGMASLYTRAADRARLAKAAISKLDRTPSEQSIPASSGKVREPGREHK
jgi:hypothetical protein